MNGSLIKTDIRKLSLDQLKEYFEERGMPKFRAKQVMEWLWKKGARSFDEMTNVSKDLRLLLNQEFVINGIQTDTFQKSQDGTIKTRFALHDGHLIESVLIPVVDQDRFTVCVSSQVGCSLDCSFCATGKMKRIRNLDPGEIYDQVLLVNEQALDHYGKGITNVVFMGMGEPLLAYKNAMEGIARLTDENYGLGMSPRRITVSTAGIAKMIEKLADQEVRFNLALSLHAADDEKRDQIMSINESNNLEALIHSLKLFHQKAKGKISFEYIALKDFNVERSDAEALSRLCSHFPVKVNIIEYNPVEGVPFDKENTLKVDRFASHLSRKGITVTVRRSRGQDIDAACGQLANKG